MVGGRRLMFQRSFVVTGKDFPVPGMRVRVVAEQSFYATSGSQVQVLLLQTPLTTTISAASVLWRVLRGR